MTSASASGADVDLVIGPLLRYVSGDEATIWVETSGPCTVRVTLDDGPESSADTWSVHGHHFAIVMIEGLEGLEGGKIYPYRVELDGTECWPVDDGFPHSVIRPPSRDDRLRVTFGSCRRTAPFDEANLEELGADALAALGERMKVTDASTWPDLLLFVGDQVYADNPSAAMIERLRQLHPEDDPIGEEVHDFEEYTWLYAESWSTPEIRWVLSTLPSCMILDDHDLRDDWNSSWDWRNEIVHEPWWRDRVLGAFGSYWIYQHLGNLSAEELAADEKYLEVIAAPDEETRNRLVDDFAWRADDEPSSSRWSYYRDFGRNRLIVIDSRCSRDLDPDRRKMVDEGEWAWLVDKATHDVDHLLVGTTLPYLLLPGIHDLEGWNEATSEGAWGKLYSKLGERLRLALDLEHWAAFRNSFDDLTDLIADRASSDSPPSSVLVMSGDIHCSYTAEATLPAVEDSVTRVHQLVMSPIRNTLQRSVQLANRFFRTRGAHAVLGFLARRSGVEDPAITWGVNQGLWFTNGLMTVEIEGRTSRVVVETARVEDGLQRLVEVGTYVLADGSAPSEAGNDAGRTELAS